MARDEAPQIRHGRQVTDVNPHKKRKSNSLKSLPAGESPDHRGEHLNHGKSQRGEFVTVERHSQDHHLQQVTADSSLERWTPRVQEDNIAPDDSSDDDVPLIQKYGKGRGPVSNSVSTVSMGTISTSNNARETGNHARQVSPVNSNKNLLPARAVFLADETYRGCSRAMFHIGSTIKQESSLPQEDNLVLERLREDFMSGFHILQTDYKNGVTQILAEGNATRTPPSRAIQDGSLAPPFKISNTSTTPNSHKTTEPGAGTGPSQANQPNHAVSAIELPSRPSSDSHGGSIPENRNIPSFEEAFATETRAGRSEPRRASYAQVLKQHHDQRGTPHSDFATPNAAHVPKPFSEPPTSQTSKLQSVPVQPSTPHSEPPQLHIRIPKNVVPASLQMLTPERSRLLKQKITAIPPRRSSESIRSQITPTSKPQYHVERSSTTVSLPQTPGNAGDRQIAANATSSWSKPKMNSSIAKGKAKLKELAKTLFPEDD